MWRSQYAAEARMVRDAVGIAIVTSTMCLLMVGMSVAFF